MAAEHGKLRLLDPTLAPLELGGSLSPRLDALAGKTLGMISNGRESSELILRRLAERLREGDGVADVIYRSKPFIGNIAPSQLFEELSARCDAVVTGVGD